LIETGLPDDDHVRKAVGATFQRRKSHDIPKGLQSPSADLSKAYRDMASECGVNKKTMDEAFETLKAYWAQLYPHKG